MSTLDVPSDCANDYAAQDSAPPVTATGRSMRNLDRSAFSLRLAARLRVQRVGPLHLEMRRGADAASRLAAHGAVHRLELRGGDVVDRASWELLRRSLSGSFGDATCGFDDALRDAGRAHAVELEDMHRLVPGGGDEYGEFPAPAKGSRSMACGFTRKQEGGGDFAVLPPSRML